jgi:hypothetical protein
MTMKVGVPLMWKNDENSGRHAWKNYECGEERGFDGNQNNEYEKNMERNAADN